MDKKNTTIAGLITALLVSAGVNINELTEDDLNTYLADAWYCELTNEAYFFDRLSGSGQRGYPTAGTTAGYVDCRDGSLRGEWQPLYDYAIAQGFDPIQLLIQGSIPEPQVISNWGRIEVCTDNCKVQS